MKNYYIERDKKSIEQLSRVLKQMPDYCFDYFIGIENYTSALTRINYACDLEIFFEYLSKYVYRVKIKDITLDQLDQLKSKNIEQYLNYISYYEKDGKSHANSEKGKARKLASLRSFFKYLFNKDYISKNVISKIDTPKIHQKEIIRLDTDEVVKILNEAENQSMLTKKQQSFKNKTSTRDFTMLSLMLGTGIRVSECVGLNVNDIDIKNNAFKVTRKGGNQVVLYYPDEVKNALIEWMEKRKIMLGDSDENALFISLQKKRMCVRAVENMVKKYSKIASPLKKITPHKLRSTFGTNLYRETQDIYIVAEVLGHKDVNTTKKHYAAISEDLRRQAANKVKLR